MRWTCPECGAVSTGVKTPLDRGHRADCSWLRGLDAPPDVTRASLTAAIHGAMCDVSHHDSQSQCKNDRKYELIGESVWRRLR